jgi:uncharacterized membrane protein
MLRRVCVAGCRAVLALAAIAAGGCGGDDPTGADSLAITLALSSSSVSVAQGGAGTITVSVTRQGEVGDVAISVSGLPAGVTASQLTLAAGTTSGTLTLSAAGNATVGTGSAVVTASASGVTSVTQPLSVTVQQASPGGFSLNAASATVTLAAGGSVNLSLNIARAAPFSGAVALASVNTPAGFTVTFNPQSVTGNQSIATIAAASTVTPGTFQITIQGTGAGGVASQSVTVTATVTPPPGYTLSLATQALSVTAGSQGNVTVNVNRTNGFAGTVTLSAAGGPVGTTATFSPPGVTANSSVLTLSLAATAVPGTYPVTVTGTSVGVPNQTATLTLTVTAPPSFSLALSPSTVQLQQGTSSNVTVDIVRAGGFSGAVTLNASGLPAGVTASFNPASPTGSSSVLTLSASGGASPNTYSVTITGSSGSGAPAAQETDVPAAVDVNVTLTLIITVPSGSTTINVDFCGATGYPVAVFYQNGTGPWAETTGLNGQYTFTISQDRGGIAWVVDTGSEVEVRVYQGTRAELQAYNTAVSQCNGSFGPGKTVLLTATGLGTFDQGMFALGNSFASVTGGTGGSGTFRGVRQGPVDFFGGRNTFTVSGQNVTGDLNRVFMQRSLNPPASTTVTADFEGPSAAVPVSGQLTINGIGSDPTVMAIGYWTGNKSYGLIGFDGSGSTLASRTWKGFPASLQQPGDFHFLQAVAYGPNFQSPTRTRTAMVVTQGVSNRTLNLGPDLAAVTISTVRSAPLRLQASLARQAEYASVYDFSATQGAKEVIVEVTSGYLGNPSTVVVQWPDFQGVQGFNEAWLPVAGGSINWTFGATGFLGSPAPSEGKLVSLASRMGTFTP